MAARCSEAQRPAAASDGSLVGQAGVLPCLELPTYAAACALVNSRYSCLVVGPHQRHIALSPRYLNRKRTGIREQLDAELLRYSESLLGVPIAYDNIKVVGELGDIYDDQGHIHLNVEADFVIFCPEPGQKLMGIVNKVSSSHIGCLVHGCFNASIPKPEQLSAEQWQTMEINMGDELEFEVFRLDSDAAGVFCIRGKLNITSLQFKRSEVSEEVTENGTEEAAKKPKKKKKKDPETYEVDSGTTKLADDADDTPMEESALQNTNNVNGIWEEEPKKKKKKKKKHQEVQDQDPVFQGSDSSGYQSDHKKKKKKRKHSEEAEFTPPLKCSPKRKGKSNFL
ncbi:DNA-directed RNA polymerase I subunit RPA43 [Pongo pygmaeus]|uniref:DNA-directed RNA polymerase subunit n=1 Tax=Pongo abelii TaxID=9601 RepID=A0A2J8VEB4_PONAB|nr:DNA-directed RNA polymerase I subunit RPA43 isoform X2 [Pongo abelii]XP_054352192.1 DNA-directed RNA polymerase I subunit RPA43 isoform X2 [Pongo pygmaeus]PNJ55852.1 TWISTNB isoform 1 [Pongo abelii]